MKKLFATLVFVFLLSCAGVQAVASPVTDAVQAAIAAGHFEKLDSIAASTPGAPGEIALFLLHQAKASIAGNATLAARLFSAAAPFAGQIPVDRGKEAAALIASILATVRGAGFQSVHSAAASVIFAAALGMTRQPNILAVAPDLHAETLMAANRFLEKNPQAKNDVLKEVVSLSAEPVTPSPVILQPVILPPVVPPLVGPQGARVPSAE